MRTIAAVVAAFIGPLVLAPSALAQSSATVTVGPGTSYSPASVTLDPGARVTWTWAEGNHSVTFADGPDSKVQSAGATYSRTFPSAGTYRYLCSVHGSGMAGTVTVRGNTSPSPKPTSASPSAKPTTAAPTPSRTSARPSPTQSPTASPSRTASPTPTKSPTLSARAAAATPTPTTSPSPSPTPTVAVEVPREVPPDRTGLALVIGTLLAVAGLGGAGWIVWRLRAAG